MPQFKEEEVGGIINSDINPVRIKILKNQKNENLVTKQAYGKKQCHLCDFKHTQHRKIEQHLYEEHDQKDCRDCGQSFDNFFKFYKHRVQSHGESWQCSECSLVFKSHQSMKYHQEKVHRMTKGAQKRWKKCEHCEFTAKFEKVMTKHLFEQHEQTMCSKCGENFSDYSAYSKHCRQHDPLKCQYCPAEFTTLSGLRQHENNHERNREKNPEDYVEKKKYDKNKNFKMCPKCGKSILSASFKRHLLWYHAAPEPCPVCGIVVKNVKRHMRTNQCNVPEEERTVDETAPCHICSKVIKKRFMDKHIKFVHESEKKIVCGQCGYKTNSNFNMLLHTKRVHEKKPLKEACPHCDKEFVNLANHIETYHTSVF